MLLKYLKEVIYAENADRSTDKAEITDDTKNELMKMVANEMAIKEKGNK